jgi:hypothetical protein
MPFFLFSFSSPLEGDPASTAPHDPSGFNASTFELGLLANNVSMCSRALVLQVDTAQMINEAVLYYVVSLVKG